MIELTTNEATQIMKYLSGAIYKINTGREVIELAVPQDVIISLINKINEEIKKEPPKEIDSKAPAEDKK